MTTRRGRHVGIWWMLGALAACGGERAGGGGGQVGACAPGPAPETAEQEVLGDHPDGQRCVVLSCAELDPDQTGVLGGTDAIGPDTRQTQVWTLGRFGKGCESGKPASCDPHRYNGHLGGNWRHNVCANVYGPYPNDYYTLPLRGEILGKDGDDAVLNGYCLDGIHFERDGLGRVIVYVFWEMKAARYGTSRLSGRPVCLFIRKKILANVVASILKEYPAVRLCGDNYRYEVVFADRELWEAFNVLRTAAVALKDRMDKPDPGTAAVHLVSWTRPASPEDVEADLAVSINSLLSKELKIPQPDLAEAKEIVIEYLTGPLPVSVRRFRHSPACDNWSPGDRY